MKDSLFARRIALSLALAAAAASGGCVDSPDPHALDGSSAALLATEECTTNQVPAMTGPTTPAGAVTRSGAYSASYEAWQAFDASDTSMWISAVDETPAWIAYDLPSGPQAITSYAINFVNGSLTTRAPRDWTFEGWDGSGWVVLDQRVGETGWLGSERRAYQVAMPGAYARYRLNVTDDNDPREGVVVVSMGRLELMGCDCTATNLVPTMTSPTVPAGVVTRSGAYSSAYEGWKAFDASDTSMWISKVNQTPAWIAYELPNGARTITSYAINFVNGSLTSRAPRDWTFEGWNGSAWVVLDQRIAETGWAGSEKRTYAVASPGAYGKYRLNVTDDNDSRAGVVVVSMGRLELKGCDCTEGSQVPVMTGATTPTGQVTRSGAYSSSYEAWQAFDSSDTSMWISGVYETPAWLAYDWQGGTRTITSYAINFVNGSLTTRAPRDWTFEGWDGSQWVVVDQRVAETNWAGSERREYEVASPGSYASYRLNMTDDNDDRPGVVVVSMGRLELFGSSCE